MSFSAKADMDKICYIHFDYPSKYERIYEFISKFCQRNNIVHLINIGKGSHNDFATEFCRYDRNIIRNEDELSCVLYDVKPRTLIE